MSIRYINFPGALVMVWLALCPFTLGAQSWKAEATAYIQKCLAKPDGGYGWEDQPDGHLTPTWAVTGILYNLDKLPADRSKLIEYIKTHHPQRGSNKEAGPSGTEERDLVYQQIQALCWLQGDVSSFANEVMAWKPQHNKVSNFEEHGYPVFLQEMMTPVCRSLLHASMQDVSAHFTAYLLSRRRGNGSFNNAPAADGGDGNIINTWWGLYGSSLINQKIEKTPETVRWIQACQLKNGGFTHQPDPLTGPGGDVAYTWAAVNSLKLLSAQPADRAGCIRYLISLHNDDGGFGNRVGLPSTPVSTFYAIDALKKLDAFAVLDTVRFARRPVKKAAGLSGLNVFSVQFEASGSGSPAEAVMLAGSLHINLWGTKNSSVAWRAAAQRIADEKKVPVIFFQADEAYGKTVTVSGQGTFSHVMDYIAPATSSKEPELDGSSWQRYRQSFIEPLLKANGALILQVTNNEPLGRMILDESVQQGGYAAVSTIHFGQNFLFWLPWLQQYRHQLPFIALQDAHGTESWWWADELAGYRTLFVAPDGSYEAMMQALKNNRIVAVRHDSISGNQTRMLGGAAGVPEYIRAHESSWKWWKEDNALNRPWAAVTVIRAADSFEVAKPAAGINIRVRCRWSGVRQTLKAPMVTLESLTVDNVAAAPVYVEKKDKKGEVTDCYYLYEMPKPAKGKHAIQATVRDLKSNTTRKMTSAFTW